MLFRSFKVSASSGNMDLTRVNAISNGIIINYSKDSNVVKQKGIIELTFKILGTGNGALPIDISMTKAIEITQNTDGKDDKTDTVYSIVSGIVTVS